MASAISCSSEHCRSVMRPRICGTRRTKFVGCGTGAWTARGDRDEAPRVASLHRHGPIIHPEMLFVPG